MKKWAFIDRSPTQNRASGGPFGSSRTSFRVLMYAACPLARLPRFLPRLMKSEVNTAISSLLEESSAPEFRAWKQAKRGSGCLRKDGFDARLERHRAGEGYSYGCPVF